MVVDSPQMMATADAIVLPGVGSFNFGMSSLNRLGFTDAIRHEVLERKKPILGICLGMQLIATEGDEGGKISGLGIIRAHVEQMDSASYDVRLPHIGWDDITSNPSSDMFAAIPDQTDFYFVHSYHVVADEPELVNSTCTYGAKFNASIQSEHIWATQFHPEKSQKYGIQLLANFASYVLENR